MINVALVDDQQLVRQGIAGLLSLSDDINIIWQSDNGEHAQQMLANEELPDVLLLDIRMPKVNGIELVKTLRGQGSPLPILMLTTFDDSELFMQCLQAGANGFLLKDISLAKLVNAVKTLADGGFVAEPVVMKQITKGLAYVPVIEDLTEKERQILKLLAGGFSNKEIANSIFLAEGTVKNHVSKILSKLNTRDRTRAVLIALNQGLVQLCYVLDCAQAAANKEADHERTLFVIAMLKTLYLRVSELSDRSNWEPVWKHFWQDSDGNSWLKVLGKGNKLRDVSVPNSLWPYIKRYQDYRQSQSVSFGLNAALVAKNRGVGGMTARQLRRIVQYAFDVAHDKMRAEGFVEEAQALREATTHWLRHTGASEDIATCPLKYLADDLGHASMGTTDQVYIQSDMKDRARTGKEREVQYCYITQT